MKNGKILIITNTISDEINEGQQKLTYQLVSKLAGSERVDWVTYATKCSRASRHFPSILSPALLWQMIRLKYRYILFVPVDVEKPHYWLMAKFLSAIFRKKVGLLIGWYHKKEPPRQISFCRPDLFITASDIWKVFQEYPGRKFQIQSAVDTKIFSPVSQEEKLRLKKKLGLPLNEKVVMHAGHLTEGRRLGWMAELPKGYRGLLLRSTFHEQVMPEAEDLYFRLLNRKNVTIVEGYLAHIEEYFQASDVYVFTADETGAINVPLSVFEALSCNLPVVSTRIGELENIPQGEGLFYVSGEDIEETIRTIDKASKIEECHTRDKVKQYDWQYGQEEMSRILLGEKGQ